ncbi:choline transporter-like, partial [Kipferlia bialata]
HRSWTIETLDYVYVGVALLGTWWGLFFVLGLCQTTISMCVANWYFTRDRKHLAKGLVTGSFFKVIFFHSMSVAIGSFFIALLTWLRLIFQWVKTQVKEKESSFAKYLMGCIDCCLWVFEKALKYVNKIVYVSVAISGKSYCGAAGEAIPLLAMNTARVVALNVIVFASMLMSVVEVVIDTVFYSFLIDDKMHGDKEAEQYFAPRELHAFLKAKGDGAEKGCCC